MKRFEEYKDAVNKALLPALHSAGPMPEKLEESMAYSLSAGGKRLRPVLLLASCEAAGGDPEEAMAFACALEMIHTYSLIHDDLPALDNDELRRGKPTNHMVFGEAGAILAGDGLLNTAAEVMARAASGMNDLRGTKAMACIMRHAGVSGMIGGQSLDVASENQEPDEELLTYIHLHKTADLLEAAVEAGLILAGAEPELVEAGRQFACHYGLAFQMTDDLLDVDGDAALMGKNTGMDAEQHKMTWVALKGVEKTREDAEREIRLACEALDRLPWELSIHRELAGSLLDRKY
ncbi:MAG: polyprenyl synthetase family protein [Clostridia bacterium]|nr:polyprenyl synthetase family protein [Clostridia bacterium]